MRLLARSTITVDCDQDCPVVAMLRPRSGTAQWVISERYEVTPWVPATEYVDSFGNLCQRYTVPRGQATIAVESEVEVADHLSVDFHAPYTPIELVPDDALVYLLQSRYCPSDKLENEAREIVQGVAPGYAQVERIRQWIHENHEYKYGVSQESTDAIDTMQAKAGVSRDFAHIGVALCRGLKIPARVVVGYLHQLDPMDLHAWFEAFVGGRWYTFDATQTEPMGGRIVVAYGRDIADVAFLSNYGPMQVTEMRVTVDLAPTATAAPSSRA
jgi:transglutaminase-like putative cysteine protease